MYRGNEPIGVILPIYMEILQGNSLCSFLSQTSKNVMFLFFSFFFNKTGEQEEGRGPGWGNWYQWEGEGGRERGRVNIVQKMCTHVCKCKNDIC
jgi:hypothetical protein